MIKNSPIVEDIRRIRNKISEKFDHDIDRYIAYLQSEATSRQTKKTVQGSNNSENRVINVENPEQTRKETRVN